MTQNNFEAKVTAKILVVDDSPDLLRLTQVALKRDGHTVTGAESGRQALEVLAVNRDFQMILVDVNMPEMSGPEFLVELEEVIPDASKLFRILFLTGGDYPRGTIAHGFVRKGQDLESFRSTIRKYLFPDAPQVRNVSLPSGDL